MSNTEQHNGSCLLDLSFLEFILIHAINNFIGGTCIDYYISDFQYKHEYIDYRFFFVIFFQCCKESAIIYLQLVFTQ